MGFDAAFFWTLGAAPTAAHLSTATIVGPSPSGASWEDELRPVKRAALAGRGVAVGTDVLGTAAVQRCAYHREIVAPAGGTCSLMAYLRVRGRVLGGLMLGRAGGSFPAGAIERVAALLPGIAVGRASFGLPCIGSRSGRLPSAQRPWWRWGAITLERTGHGDDGVIVRDRDGYREMVARRASEELVWTRTSLVDDARSGWPYIDLFHVAAALASNRERALFVGCGGAVSPRQFARLYPGIVADVVELDPRVIDLARRWFDLDEIPGVQVHLADGVELVRTAAAGTWDVAVIDAYEGTGLAGGLDSPSFARAMHRALRPGGVMAFNVIGSLGGTGPVARVVDAVSSAFPEVRPLPVIEVGETRLQTARRNVVVLGRKHRVA